MNDLLLHFARKLVESVLNMLKKLVDNIRERANDPIKAMIEKIVSGVWQGDGADAFVEELQKLLIPDVERSCACIEETHRHLYKAIETLDEADARSRDKINELADQFGQIYVQ